MIISPLDQDRTFYFVLITQSSFQYYFFSWNEPNTLPHLRMLNTVCGWDFLQDWKDSEYRFPTGKAIPMNNKIRKEVKNLKDLFLSQKSHENKQSICDFVAVIDTLSDDEVFFIYRIVYSNPSQKLLFKIINELLFINSGSNKEDADIWFSNNAETFYDKYCVNQYFHNKIGERERSKRICRFCGRDSQHTTFKNDAHIIPQSLGGTKELICYEECDECNKRFGGRHRTKSM